MQNMHMANLHGPIVNFQNYYQFLNPIMDQSNGKTLMGLLLMLRKRRLMILTNT